MCWLTTIHYVGPSAPSCRQSDKDGQGRRERERERTKRRQPETAKASKQTITDNGKEGARRRPRKREGTRAMVKAQAFCSNLRPQIADLSVLRVDPIGQHRNLFLDDGRCTTGPGGLAFLLAYHLLGDLGGFGQAGF